MKWKPYEYQKFAIRHIVKKLSSGLFLDMGLGKTVITLTAISQLIKNLEVSKVLIIAPLRVADDVWTGEIEKWDHLKGLKASKVLGSVRQRIKALNTKADIYIINRENVVWLVSYYSQYRWDFDLVAVDELSSFKSQAAERFKALKKVVPLTFRMIGLTGTPAPNSLMDLWAQMYLLDLGERLGKTITSYRDMYFNQNREENYVTYKLVAGADKKIHDEISDICISMEAKDYLDLPKLIERNIEITLSEKSMQRYFDFEKEAVLSIIENDLYGDQEITAINAAVLSNKLTQFASGSVYDENKTAHIVHSDKLNALAEIIEDLNGAPLLVFYGFKSSQERIQHRFKKLKPCNLKTPEDIKKWNAGNTALAVVHPASAGHGLNLQFGGHNALWYDNTWSVELKLQANKRLHRPGQAKTVISNSLVCKGTIDEEIIKRQGIKISGQQALMSAIKAVIKKYKK